MEQKIVDIKISDLNLWTENPRDPIELDSTDFDIISRAVKNDGNKWNLQNLIDKMGQFYDFSELPTIVNIKEKYVVYDGNRRIAILKYLQDKELYNQLNGGLFFSEEPKELRELKIIPCNVCDIETALINIERKHVNGGSWTKLERDYFIHKHLNREKSHFIQLDEQTGIISNHPKMNQRFIKDEVLTINNLSEIGFSYDKENGFVSNYDTETSEKIIKAIVNLIEKKVIQTQGKYRGQLKNPLIDNNPELKNIISKFDKSKSSNSLKITPNIKTNETAKTGSRKTPKTKENETLFGRNLSLKSGKVNDVYRAIVNIYEKNSNDSSILPIIGMSMRLITEVAARVYFDENDPETAKKDQLYNDFLKIAKKEMILQQEVVNYLSLTKDWLDSNNNLEAILAKYAHGNITVSKDGILQNSFIIGEILEHYYKK